MVRNALIIALLAALSPGAALAQDAPGLLADVFQDHAVLQRGAPIPVWGHAAPGNEVTVTLGQTTASARADQAGRWSLTVAPPSTGGPYQLTARSGADTATRNDILIGDVFLCSGQSNMEFTVRQGLNAGTEIGNAADDGLRLLTVGRRSLPAPDARLPQGSGWRSASPESAADFSGACFFMGKHLRQTQGVPIGLIAASWGGSIIEDWLSAQALRTAGDYEAPLEALSLYARSPEEGGAFWNTVSDRWWAASEPALRGDINWSSPAFDDSGWAAVPAEGIWETWGVPELAAFDGTLWYRTRLTLSPAQAEGEARISLGPIDDIDIVFVNGRRIGVGQGWDTPRDYAIPAGVLRAGENVIAVGALDAGGGGGMSAPASARFVTTGAGERIGLTGWRYRASEPMWRLSNPPRVPWIGGSGVTTLSNGMIAPVEGYGLAGFAWYQGESNLSDPSGYERLLTALMADWRGRFGGEDQAFLIVQLANFGPAVSEPSPSGWAPLREVQRRAAGADPHAGLAVAIDIGDRYDIHPTNKQEVGRRLALEARWIVYGDATAMRSPQPLSAAVEGGVLRIAYPAGSRLTTLGSDQVIGFTLCDAAQVCRFASGRIEGDAVLTALPTDFTPTVVRFCWADSPVCNLNGPDGLPATPFELRIGR